MEYARKGAFELARRLINMLYSNENDVSVKYIGIWGRARDGKDTV